MAEMYEGDGDRSVRPILDLYDNIRSGMVRSSALDPIRKALSEKVVERQGGWFINGHVLLTYEGDFYHPNVVSKKRDGSIIGAGSEVTAYDVSISSPGEEIDRDVGDYRLTDSELQFVAKALWAVENTPDRR
jgi:hypothetical protein